MSRTARRDPPYVAVCGAGEAPPEDARDAEAIGRLLARAGAVVVCGGRGGVMEAAARGASAEGGLSVGILPDADRGRANRFLTITVPTGLGEARNALVVRAADSLIAVGGGFGTLSEIALALKMGVPVVGMRTWGLVRSGSEIDAFAIADTPEDAVERALRLVRERRRR